MSAVEGQHEAPPTEIQRPTAPTTPSPSMAPGVPSFADTAALALPSSGQAFGDWRDAKAREAEQMRIRANAMRPEYASVRDAVSEQERVARTQIPAPPVLSQPPSRGVREFLATSENESPVSAIAKLIQATSLFVNGTAGSTRYNAMGALAAITGAMKGWYEGDAVRADRAFADWEAKTNLALKEFDTQNKAYQTALTAANTTLEGRLRAMQLKALEFGDTQAAMALESGSLEKSLDFITKREETGAKLNMEMVKLLDARNQRAEQTRQFEITSGETNRANLAREANAAEANRLKAQEGAPKAVDVDRLRAQFLKQGENFLTIKDAYGRVRTSAKDPSPAGDIAMIFNFMKILDPGSVVRESEYATAQNAGNVDDRTRALYNSLLGGGEKLAARIRNDYLDRAHRLYVDSLKGYENTEAQFRNQATLGTIDPARVVPDLVPPDMRTSAPLVERLSRKSERYKGARAKGLDDETIMARFNLILDD